MNIDLLFTSKGEAGLIADRNFMKKAIGIVYDPESGLLTIEYTDMDYIELNIPVEKEFTATLDAAHKIHMGAVAKGQIAQAYQVPLMFMNDPYRMEAFKNLPTSVNPLQDFERFMKSCIFGQPVHRDDLSDETSAGCILGDAAPSSLQFAPHLARQRNFENTRHIGPRGPSAPGIGGPGGTGSGSTTSGSGHVYRTQSPIRGEDED